MWYIGNSSSILPETSSIRCQDVIALPWWEELLNPNSDLSSSCSRRCALQFFEWRRNWCYFSHPSRYCHITQSTCFTASVPKNNNQEARPIIAVVLTDDLQSCEALSWLVQCCWLPRCHTAGVLGGMYQRGAKDCCWCRYCRKHIAKRAWIRKLRNHQSNAFWSGQVQCTWWRARPGRWIHP